MGPSADELALLAARRARIMERMGGGVMLLAAAPERPRTADILYPYRQDSDFAYVTGFPEPGDILHEMRLRKEPAELACMREAIAIACEAHREAMRTARPGMYEYEIEALIDFTFRRRGAAGPAYPSIVASGANATVLHY